MNNSDKIYLILDNNIFDLFEDPPTSLVSIFPDSDYKLIYPGEIFTEGQNIPADKVTKKEIRKIVESLIEPIGYANAFPLTFPIRFDSLDTHKTAQKYKSSLGTSDAYLIAISKHYPGKNILLTNDGLSEKGIKRKLIKAAEEEGIQVACGRPKEKLIEEVYRITSLLKKSG